jgi:hypothetical protein
MNAEVLGHKVSMARQLGVPPRGACGADRCWPREPLAKEFCSEDLAVIVSVIL